MPGGKSKFQEKWLELLDGNGDSIGTWCSKGKSENDAYCVLCKCSFSVSNSGLSQVMQHASRQKHNNASKLFKGQRTLTFSQGSANEINNVSLSNPLTLSIALTADQIVTRAEALWAIKVAMSDYSFDSCKDIIPLFKVMFDEHPVSNAMQLSERKISYVISHGLGPYFHCQTVSDIKLAIQDGAFYTLSFDETTTFQVKKQMDLLVRYWSPQSNRVACSYLTSLFFGHADANIVMESILNALKSDDLPLNKILMLSTDGPNVNLSIAKKFNEELCNLGYCSLVDIDTCVLHKVHNCFSKALDELPLDIDEFATDLFSFFKLSAPRRQDLQKVQKLLECEEKFLMRHTSSRWLTLGPVVTRILLVYKSLEEYFLKFLPKQKSSYNYLKNSERYKRIVSALQSPETVVYLEFIAALFPTFDSFLKVFQTEGPVIHLLFYKMNELLRTVLLKFMKEKCVGILEGTKLVDLDINNFENYGELDVGIGTKKAISHLKSNSAKEARLAIRSFLVKLANNLKESLPLTNNILRDLQILHPIMRNQQKDAVQRLCIKLKPLKLSDESIDLIMSEWQGYRLDTDVEKICEAFNSNNEKSIETFWKDVSEIKDISGKQKYANLFKFVKNCLIMAHGNADVERGFSLNKNIVSKNKPNISESTIKGIRHIKAAVKKYGGILDVPITGKLLHSVAKSHSAYTTEKKAVAKAAEEELKKRKADEAEQQRVENNKRQKVEKEEKMKKLKEKIQFLQDELRSVNSCLTENNEKFSRALNKKDFMTVKVLGNVIESNTNNIQKVTLELSTTQNTLSKLQSET